MIQFSPGTLLSTFRSSPFLATSLTVQSFPGATLCEPVLSWHIVLISGRVLSSLPCWWSSSFLAQLRVNQFIPGTQYSLKVEIATRYLYSVPLRLVKRYNGMVQWLLSLGDRDLWLLVCSYRSNGYWYPVKNTLLGRV